MTIPVFGDALRAEAGPVTAVIRGRLASIPASRAHCRGGLSTTAMKRSAPIPVLDSRSEEEALSASYRVPGCALGVSSAFKSPSAYWMPARTCSIIGFIA